MGTKEDKLRRLKEINAEWEKQEDLDLQIKKEEEFIKNRTPARKVFNRLKQFFE